MLAKNMIGTIFLIIGLIFLLAPVSLTMTGSVIAENFKIDLIYSYVIGIIFLFASLIIIISRQPKDTTTIPAETKTLNSKEDPFVKKN